jgi:hypothetical protein
MCVGTMLAVTALAGAGATAYGQVYSGMATGDAASYQAEVARNNALIAEQNAKRASEAGAAQATAVSLKGAAKVGKIKTAQAANNIDVNTGSAVDVRASEREAGVLDTATVLSNAELESYGYRSKATGYTAEAGLLGTQAEEAPIGAGIGATGSLLSGASSVGFKFGGGSGGNTGSVAPSWFGSNDPNLGIK